MIKKYFRTVISLILIVTMVMELMPLSVFAQSLKDENILLECDEPNEENDKSFSIATMSSPVDEGKKYIITIVRNNADTKASVFLKTIDISAKYGEDYIINDKNYEVSVKETNKTILEQSADIKEQEERKEEIKAELEDAEKKAEELEISNKTDDTVTSAEAINITDNENYSEPLEQQQDGKGFFSSLGQQEIKVDDIITSEEAVNTVDEKSSLANLKEKQTGKATRKVKNTDFQPIENMVAGNINNNIGSMAEWSSSTEIVFEDGENSKQVVIEILDDDISEGAEVIDLVLSDASEGWNIGKYVNCTLTINDNEAVEHSVIGFSQSSYDSEKGTVEITVTRSSAEYSLATVMVRTIQSGSAVESENYAKVSTLIEFAPYVNENKFNIPVQADKKMDFSIELYDVKGGVLGEISKANINIIPAEKYIANETVETLANDKNEESFTINLSGKDYTVSYVPGENVGHIMNMDVTPPVTVGEYYFATDPAHGGTFQYNQFSGDSSGAHRESEYIGKGSENAGEQGAGHLYWYHWVTGRQGTSYCSASSVNKAYSFINTSVYQCISADWKQIRTAYTGQYVEMELSSSDNNAFEKHYIGVGGNFGRSMSEPIKFWNKDNKLPVSKDIQIYLKAQDKKAHETPKIELYVYGLAVMYRKYKINLQQPSNLTYLDANGNSVSKAPAIVEAAEGHGTRYYGQDYQIKVNPTSGGEPVKGRIKEYQITVGPSSEPKMQRTFTYKPNIDNVQNISIDKNFISLVDRNTVKVSKEGYGFYTELSIKPVFEYIDVQVDVLKDNYGKFTSSKLSQGTHKFHIGDEIFLNGTPYDEHYKYIGYNEKSYKNKSDTRAEEDGDMDKTQNVILLIYERYTFKPNFSLRENYIGIKLTNNAKKYLTVLNTLDSKDVSKDDIKQDMQSGIIDYVLLTDTEKDKKNTVPTTGKAYHIQVISNNQNYIPLYSVSSSNNRAVGLCFDYIAQSLSRDNIITIDVEYREPRNEKIFAIDGVATIPSNTIRSTASNISKQGAGEITLMAGGEKADIYNTATNSLMKIIDRKSSISGSDGKFSIKGVKGYDGDVVTLYMTNGDVDQVEYIKLSSTGVKQSDIQYTEIIYNSNHQGVETPVTKKGYVMNVGECDMPIRTPLAPYVSNVTYRVDQTRDFIVDTRDNEIPILSTKIYITSSLNLNDRDAKAVVFTKVSKNGTKEETRVNRSYKGQINYEVSYKMDAEFESGDMLYVKIIDNEDRSITTNYIDEDTGKEYQITTKEERAYFSVPTGLSFYVPTIEIEPQTFDFENSAEVNIPILDNIALSQKSGSLSFNKVEHKSGNGQNNPYTLQFYFAPGYSTLLQQTAGSTISNIKKGVGASSTALLTTPEAEEEQLAANMMDLFDETNSGKGQKGFEDKYGSMAFKKSLSNMSKANPFDIHALFMLSLDFFYDYDTNQYVMVSCQYLIGAYFTVAKCMYYTIYGVPLYLKLSGTFGLSFSGHDSTNEDVISEYNFSSTSNLANILTNTSYISGTFGGSAAVGVGLCGVLGARGIVNINLSAKISYSPDINKVGNGFLFKLGGGFGVDLLLFSFEYAPSILTYGSGMYAGLSDGIITLSDDGGDLKKINLGTSDMSSFGSDLTLMNNELKPVKMTKLLENAMERTRPKITTLPDGRKFIVFVANDGTRDSINASCIMYSICDNNGVWSVPEKIDDDGTIDTLPSIVHYNDKVIILWSDSNKSFDSDAIPKDILASLEISYKIFDPNTNTFSQKTVITNDEFMDTAASAYIDSDTNEICVYYVKRDIKTAENNEELVDVAATYNTLACRKYDLNSNLWESEETYLDILHDRINDPLIIDFSTIKSVYDGKQYVWMTYTVDEDEDLTTVNDREVYIILENITDKKVYYPIAVSQNSAPDIKPQFVNYKDCDYLSWIEDGNLLKMTNLTEIFQHMKEKGYLENTEKGWYIKTAGELGISDEEYDNSIYEKLATHNLDMIEKNFSTDEYIDRVIGDYQLYNDNDKNLYTFWTEAGSTKVGDGNSNGTISELYGAIFEEGEDGEKYSGWSNAVQITDFKQAMDEFNLTFDNNGDMFMVSNMFSQKIDEKGKLSYSQNNLVEINFKRECTLSLKDEIEFSKIPAPNDEVNIGFIVCNDGLMSADGYEVTVEQVQNGTSKVIYFEDVQEQLVTGYSQAYNVLWNVPEDISDTSIVVKIAEKNVSNSVNYQKTVDKESSITISDEKAEFDSDGKLYYSAEVKNIGNISSGNIVLSALKNDKDNQILYGTHTVGSLDVGESTQVYYELTGFNTASEVTKYGFTDIVSNCNVDDKEVESNVIRAIATNVVDIVVNDDISEINLTPGQTANISAAVIPENTASKDIAYSSKNTDVVKVTTDGEITPVGNGKTEITLLHIASGFEKTIDINVSGFEIEESTTETATENTTETITETTTKRTSSGGGSGSSSSKASSESAKSEKSAENETKTEKIPETKEIPEIKINEKVSDWNNPFTDVSGNEWYSDSVKYVYENRIFSGITDSLFGPDVETTRAMLITVLGRMENINPSDYTDLSYTDVDNDMYYAPYIQWASQNNIVAGFGNSLFKPNDSVTREQLAKIIRNYLTYKGTSTEIENTELPFTDASLISQWAVEDVAYCYDKEIFSGDEKGMFNPKNSTSRAELASVIMRLNNFSN